MTMGRASYASGLRKSKSLYFSTASASGSDDSLESDAFSLTGSSTHGGGSISGGYQDGESMEYNIQVAKKEEKVVVYSKIIMIVVLVLAVAGLATATYKFVQYEEKKDFETAFESYASEVIAVSSENVKNAFGTIASFSNSITSLAGASGMIFPNVTIPDFQYRAEHLAGLIGGVRHITFASFQDDREAFEEYAQEHIYDQVQEAIDYQQQGMNSTDLLRKIFPDDVVKITRLNITDRKRYSEDSAAGPFLANWQRWPWLTDKLFIMNNMLRVPTIRGSVTAANSTHKPAFAFHDGVFGVDSQITQPVFEKVASKDGNETGKMVGIVWVVMDWGRYWTNLLPENVRGITVVMESSCGFEISYYIDGLEAELLGLFDAHDPKYEDYEVAADFYTTLEGDVDVPEGTCVDKLTIHLYPTDEFKDAYTTSKPIYYSLIVIGIFIFTTMVFLIYDWAVASRQRKVMKRIIRQDKIVSNLFPDTIRDRLYAFDDSDESDDMTTASTRSNNLGQNIPDIFGAKPIADLFLETTVLFADISGFTAWSSSREPTQVFMLLEYIYGAFDKLASKHRVFKVETIGDCYVCCTGLPDPTPDHAVIMSKFAREAMDRMRMLTNKLEITLGPDTGDLQMRMGLNSGQVTAGVLRGERSRFQLFGDTVNTAARMESTSRPSRIQLSNVTAKALIEGGRSKMVHERSEKISVHGKGMMQTYWLETKRDTKKRERWEEKQAALESSPESPVEMSPMDMSVANLDFSENETELSKKDRLVAWNTEVLCGLVRQILAARKESSPRDLSGEERDLVKGHYVLDEFQEIISLPKISEREVQQRKPLAMINLEDRVVDQIMEFVSTIASTYNPNSFHNFEHASHVTQSVAKLLSRIIAGAGDSTNENSAPSNMEIVDRAGNSYGITSDPLTQFAVVLSALIHDSGHPGVTNAQLISEDDLWASKFRGKSMAEQNSVNLCWTILMSPEYADFRACIYSDEDELKRFRQLVVNTVMATDICDKEFNALRKARWAKAFSETAEQEDPPDLCIDRKATIVIEHLIQASDVAHTMQHWHVYKMWNKRFFMECYGAYMSGRGATDPSLGWYKGEIGFFDFYIIPLAKKLDNCGVFGVSSHEYLGYAVANRDQWERTGQEIVKEYLADYNKQHGILGGGSASAVETFHDEVTREVDV